MSKIVTRFAPSPTGFLHIGSARTALFNWLFARKHGGKFSLRVEDTDRERSTKEAIEAIFKSMTWLGFNWDGDVVFQSKNAERHQEIGQKLLESGHAYYCTCTPEELAAARDEARAQGKPLKYNGKCRNAGHTAGALRLRVNEEGATTLKDLVQGEVTVQHKQLDDMILLRSDGSPTYMLSVVVDDHDMGITHIVRGDDHLTNAFRQTQIYKALGWDVPTFAHIPLIHGPDGAKLSKRHGALGAEEYEKMGYLPEAMRNYLLRLGWGYGDEEIIDDAKAKALFSLERIGKSPARFDIQKLEALNHHYIKGRDPASLVDLIQPFLGKHLTDADKSLLKRGMPGLQQRAKTIKELAQNAAFYVAELPLTIDEKAQKFCTDEHRTLCQRVIDLLQDQDTWTEEGLEGVMRTFAEENDLKLGKVAQPLRVALTGSTISPSVFDIMHVLGKAESIKRLQGFASA